MKTILHAGVFTGFSAAFALLPPLLHAQQGAPHSAIDWLSRSVQVAPVTIAPQARPTPDEPPVSNNASTPQVTTTPLGGPSLDPIGLLPPAVTGLPRSLWAGSDEATLIALLQAKPVSKLPAIQTLLKTLLQAEADAPMGASQAGDLFLARVDKLLDLAALEPAQAMLVQAKAETPELFRRFFDTTLLTETEHLACDTLLRRTDVAPTYAARIFCLARNGDWSAAVLSLNTHKALGDISASEDALLARFLDPELFEGAPPLGRPDRVSPLNFRMYEAIGERMNTRTLPLAFAHADLRNSVGWKSQIEAAERLARNNALSSNVLYAFYTSRRASASGGVWERVKAVQAFDSAIRSENAADIARTLPAAWQAAQDARVETAFATEYSMRLAATPLTGAAAEIGFRVALLSRSYETAAQSENPPDAFLAAIARGEAPQNSGSDPVRRAIAAAFDAAEPPELLTRMADEDRLGEALLRTIAMINVGMDGDTQALTDALAFLRAAGLEDVARRASFEALILERRP